jgi:hypothetical protein
MVGIGRSAALPVTYLVMHVLVGRMVEGVVEMLWVLWVKLALGG